MNAPHAPLVVIAAVSEGAMKEKVEERLRDVGKKWRVRTEGSGAVNGREVVWALMDKTRWGQWLKSMYGIQKDVVENGFEDVKVIIADHRVSSFYLLDGFR
jgi:thioredoxin domain-containing protein 5